jgi:hypothetical protein
VTWIVLTMVRIGLKQFKLFGECVVCHLPSIYLFLVGVFLGGDGQ